MNLWAAGSNPRAATKPSKSGGTVTVAFESKELAPKMELYEVDEQHQDLVTETGVVDSLGKAPVGGRLAPGIPLSAGTEKAFVLVMRNRGPRDAYFFAVPHVAHPEEGSADLHFECLCSGMIYQVPAGKVWYRIVRLQADAGFQTKRVTLSHTLVGVKAAEATGPLKAKLFGKVPNASP